MRDCVKTVIHLTKTRKQNHFQDSKLKSIPTDPNTKGKIIFVCVPEMRQQWREQQYFHPRTNFD